MFYIIGPRAEISSWGHKIGIEEEKSQSEIFRKIFVDNQFATITSSMTATTTMTPTMTTTMTTTTATTTMTTTTANYDFEYSSLDANNR